MKNREPFVGVGERRVYAYISLAPAFLPALLRLRCSTSQTLMISRQHGKDEPQMDAQGEGER